MKRSVLFALGLTTILTASAGAWQTERYNVRVVPLPDGFSYSSANAVNGHGEVAGTTSGSNGSRSIMYENGHAELLDNLGGMLTFGAAINEHGQIAGSSESQPWWGFKAVRWEPDGSMTVVAPLTNDENDNIYAFGINNLGQMVGQSDTDNGYWRAYFWDEQSGIVDLGTLGGPYSGANDVNDDGVVVGWASGPGGEHPFIWQQGDDEVTALPTLLNSDFPGGEAHAINNEGIIVGEANGETYGIVHAVMWDEKGDIHELGSLGGIWSRAYDINDAGVIVGEAQAANGEIHAFIYQNGQMRDLNTFLPSFQNDWVLERATGISRDGRIVGIGTLNGQSRGFVLEPVGSSLSR